MLKIIVNFVVCISNGTPIAVFYKILLMKTRFKIFSILSLLISSIGLSQCQSAKIKLQKKTPFTIQKAYYQDWMGGQPGNSGTTVQLMVNSTKEVQPDSLFFQNRVAHIEIKPSDKVKLWVANFRKVVRKDINMTDNPTGEYGNPVPEMTNFPFELEKDEAVLMYSKDAKVYYFKIAGLVQKETVFFPAAKPRN